MSNNHPIFDEIRSLLDSAALAGVEQIEDTLTAGYAAALALEAERWRVERRIAEVAGMLDSKDGRLQTEELAKLSKRLTVASDELARLRGMLSSLRARADEARAA